jgi:hypothetical protein
MVLFVDIAIQQRLLLLIKKLTYSSYLGWMEISEQDKKLETISKNLGKKFI